MPVPTGRRPPAQAAYLAAAALILAGGWSLAHPRGVADPPTHGLSRHGTPAPTAAARAGTGRPGLMPIERVRLGDRVEAGPRGGKGDGGNS